MKKATSQVDMLAIIQEERSMISSALHASHTCCSDDES